VAGDKARNTAVSGTTNGFWENEDAGVAETGCDSGRGLSVAQQAALLQSQAGHAEHTSPVSAAPAGMTRIQTSSRLQTSASAVFMLQLSCVLTGLAALILLSAYQFLARSVAWRRLMIVTFVTGLNWLLRRFLFRFRHFLQILGRFLVEIFFAALAAQLDFLALILKYERLAHFSQLFIGDGAGVQFIRFGRGLFLLGGKAGERGSQDRGDESNDGKVFDRFHNVVSTLFIIQRNESFRSIFFPVATGCQGGFSILPWPIWRRFRLFSSNPGARRIPQ
jgi:hypothetical protein